MLKYNYDDSGDVLYIASKSVPSYCESKPGGILLRWSDDSDRPSGVTVIGYFSNGWDNFQEELAEIVHLHMIIYSIEEVKTFLREMDIHNNYGYGPLNT